MRNENASDNSDNIELREGGIKESSPSPRGAAYRRTLTDIKFAKEIYQAAQEISAPHSIRASRDFNDPNYRELVITSEAKYKLADYLIKENKVHQILEVAAGLSPRGLNWTEADPSLKFVEVDLPEKAVEKRRILEKLYNQGVALPRPNLEVCEGSALDLDSLMSATRHFEKQPIAVINEGLLRYLDFNERKIVAGNIHTLLERYGGIWITPDINLQESAKTRQSTGYSESLEKKILANRFNSEEEARQFFENLGFTVERHSFEEAPGRLASSEQMGMSDEEAAKATSKGVLFVMKVKF